MYLNKYSCSECNTSQWTVSNPLQCQRCAGTMVMIEQGTHPLRAKYYQQREGEVKFDWEEFNQWWGEVNA